MANYKLNYSGEKIDELLTKIDNLGTGTDTKSGTVKLSSATDSNSGVSDGVAATPAAVKTAYDAAIAANDSVDALIPKVDKNTDSIAANKEAVSQLKGDMDTKANKSDVLSLEEIQASTDLSGKIASAGIVNNLSKQKFFNNKVNLSDGSFGFVICRVSSEIHVVLAVIYYSGYYLNVIELYKTQWVNYTINDNVITFDKGECIYIGA